MPLTKTIIVEGNIGSGKTTFLNYLKHNDNYCILEEPIKKWQNCGGANLLDNFYNDPINWGMPFQTYVIMTLLENHLFRTDKPFKIMERSLLSSEYCFVKNMHDTGLLDTSLFTIINSIYNYVNRNVDPTDIDAIVYIRTSPEIVHERMLKRARYEEDGVSLEYLTDLHNLHERWLIEKIECPIPVIILNGDLDEKDMLEEYKRVEKLFTEQ